MDDYRPMPFHLLLKIHRETSAITEEELAYQIGCSPELVRSVERGTSSIPAELLQVWASCLGTSAYFLAIRHLNDVALKFCKRSGLACSLSVQLTPSITGEFDHAELSTDL